MIVIVILLAGFAGGAIWAIFAGLLRTYGKVNEIFGGLGLFYVAQGLAIWLIFGPWQREGIASASGTDPFPRESWLPTLGNTRLSLVAVLVAAVSVIVVFYLLRGT